MSGGICMVGNSMTAYPRVPDKHCQKWLCKDNRNTSDFCGGNFENVGFNKMQLVSVNFSWVWIECEPLQCES